MKPITQKQYIQEYLKQIQNMNFFEATNYISNERKDRILYQREGWNNNKLRTESQWRKDIYNELQALHKVYKKIIRGETNNAI